MLFGKPSIGTAAFMVREMIFGSLRRYRAFIFVALVGLFILTRAGVLLFGHVHISHPAFDETGSGALACDLLAGQLRGPIYAYQYESRSGDSLMEGLIITPFFMAFGRSLFV
jgi:hypothetical protein